MKFNKKNIYITLFGILYGGVALVSLIHAVSFFALANILWLAILLAVIFEIGQSAVLFSILTSSTGKSKTMPWILMCILTAVQILGNVFSSYKYIVSNSPENLRFFKEPVFIWTDIPDAQATVIITYIVGGILPLVALAMSAMVTNYLEDEKTNQEEIPKEEIEVDKDEKIKELEEKLEKRVENLRSIENTTNKEVKKLTNTRDNLIEENKALKEKLKDIPIETTKENNKEEKLKEVEEKPIETNNDKKEEEIDESTLEQANQMMQGNVEKMPEIKKSHFINI